MERERVRERKRKREWEREVRPTNKSKIKNS